MSYQIIRVYSFECDQHGCTTDPYEVIQPSLARAKRELAALGWRSKSLGGTGGQL